MCPDAEQNVRVQRRLREEQQGRCRALWFYRFPGKDLAAEDSGACLDLPGDLLKGWGFCKVFSISILTGEKD